LYGGTRLGSFWTGTRCPIDSTGHRSSIWIILEFLDELKMGFGPFFKKSRKVFYDRSLNF
jgi:hypothetical protein